MGLRVSVLPHFRGLDAPLQDNSPRLPGRGLSLFRVRPAQNEAPASPIEPFCYRWHAKLSYGSAKSSRMMMSSTGFSRLSRRSLVTKAVAP